MTEEEFGKWYRANMDMMIEAGIYHPNSEGGRWVRTALIAATRQYGPILDQMQKRIVALEALVHGEKTKISPKQKQPIVEEVKVEEPIAPQPKKVEAKQPTTKARRKPVSKGWSV